MGLGLNKTLAANIDAMGMGAEVSRLPGDVRGTMIFWLKDKPAVRYEQPANFDMGLEQFISNVAKPALAHLNSAASKLNGVSQ